MYIMGVAQEGLDRSWFKQYFIPKYIQYTTYTCTTNTSNIQKGSRRKSNDLFESVSQIVLDRFEVGLTD